MQPAKERSTRNSKAGGMDERLDAWRDQPLRVLSRLTAESRGWLGFSAMLFEVGGGTSEAIVFPRHTVMMLVGDPLNTTVSCDGAAESRLQLPGTFDVFPARSSVSCTDAGRTAFFYVGLEHSLVCQTAYSMGMNADRITFEQQLTCRDPQIEHIMLALKAELELEHPGGRACADSLAVALAAQLLRRWGRSKPKQLNGTMRQSRLQRVLAYIDDRLSSDLSLSDIADVAGMSMSHLSALFKNSLGMPVHRYIVARRVERAIDLITHSRLPLSDIALLTGFAHQSHMAMAVRRSTGVTPKGLRSTHG